jgi:single-strand DNA-binding protein
MASFNKVILMGNLTRDPEVRYTTGGMAVCDIALAVSHNWTDKKNNERKEDTSFIDVTLWGRTAEIAGEYLAKGRQVLIEGRLSQDRWDDKETGQKRSKLKVIAEEMKMVGGRPDGAGGGGSTTQRNSPAKTTSPATRSQELQSNSEPERTPDQTFYDDMPSGGDDVPF